jgi:alkanesulfonate monooxygenase SsuD/methylene tetrahydromethanopterin reductase-like flavin-dependent oxidoreductase (luciferase family)
VRFDLFHELALPDGGGRTEADVYAGTLAQIAHADALGYRCAWLVEHHFLRGYSHCAKPELVLAAAAQATRAIRLGHAVIPLPLHHPVHVAERVATLDILSGGRLEVGVGRGFSPREYEVFGARMEASRELADEALAILRASFTREPVTHHGRHWRLEALDILPHVVQRPHPPLWTAAVSPQTYTWAAERGLGVLAGPFKPWFMVKQDIGRYRAAWRHATAPRIGMTVGVLCLADGARARALAQPAFTWFYRELYKTTLPVLEKLYPSYEEIHEMGRFRQLIRLGIDFGLADLAGLAVVGTPAECIAKLRKYADAGVTNLMCAFGAGAVDDAVVRESMTLFAREVMPAFDAERGGERGERGEGRA